MADNIQKVILTADDKTKAAFSSFRDSVNAAKTSTDNLKQSANEQTFSGMIASAGRATLAVAGIGLSIGTLVSSIRGVAEATIKLQQFENTLKVGVGSAENVAKAISFIRDESQRLGLDLVTSSEQFSKLTVAAKGTALEGESIKRVFTSVAQAATACQGTKVTACSKVKDQSQCANNYLANCPDCQGY